MPDRASSRRYPVGVLAGAILVALIAPLGAQVAPARNETLAEKVRFLRETGQLMEAAQLCRDDLKQQDQLLAQHPDDPATIVAWCKCRNLLAEHLYQNQLREAKTLLNETRDRLQALIARTPSTEARAELAHTWELVATVDFDQWLNDQAEKDIRQAIEIQRKLGDEPGAAPERRVELVRMLSNQAGYRMQLARDEEAIAAYEEALTVGRKLAADRPELPEPVMHLALTYNSYALLVRESGENIRAAQMIREAIRLLTTLETRFPDRPEFWYMLPTFYRNLSQPLSYLGSTNEATLAKHEGERAEARLAKFPDAAKRWVTDQSKVLGAVATWDADKLGQMGTEVENSLKKAEANYRRWPEAPLYRSQLVEAKLAQGLMLAKNDKPAQEVLPLFAESMAMSDKLAEQFPDVPRYRVSRPILRITFGFAQLGFGQMDEAEASFTQGIADFQKLADEYPQEPEIRNKLTQVLVPLFPTLMMLHDLRRAGWILAVAEAQAKKLAEEHPRCLKLRRPYPTTLAMRVQLHFTDGKFEAAEAAECECIAQWRKIVADFPANADVRGCLAGALSGYAQLLGTKQRFTEASPLVQEMLSLHQGLVKQFPDNPEYLTQLAVDYTYFTDILEMLGKFPEAVEQMSRGVRCREAAYRQNPRRRDWLEGLKNAYLRLSDLYLKLDKRKEYEQCLAETKWMTEYLESPLLRIDRIQDRLAKGERAAALREADDLFVNCDLTSGNLDELAACYAKAASPGTPANEQEQQGARAVEALRRSCELGRMSFVALESDPRYRAIADRADFKKLAGEQRK